MKLLFILMVIPAIAFSCKKNKDVVKDKLLKGKIIRMAACAGPIVQVLNDDSIGEDGWKDIRNNNAQHDNVFTVNNPCNLSLPGKGSVFYFKIDYTESGCIHCAMYDGAPMKRYAIGDVSVE